MSDLVEVVLVCLVTDYVDDFMEWRLGMQLAVSSAFVSENSVIRDPLEVYFRHALKLPLREAEFPQFFL